MVDLLSIGILLCGIYIVISGYLAIQKKQMKLLPLNRRKMIIGEAAVKEGKKFLAVGIVIVIIGIIFLIIPQ